LLGAFNRDGSKIKERKASAFSVFVKENYKQYRKEHVSHGDTMSALGQAWKSRNPE